MGDVKPSGRVFVDSVYFVNEENYLYNITKNTGTKSL